MNIRKLLKGGVIGSLQGVLLRQGFERWLGPGEVLENSFIWKNCLLSTCYECTVSIWEGSPGDVQRAGWVRVVMQSMAIS